MLGVYYSWCDDRGTESEQLGIYDADKLEQAKEDVLQWVVSAKEDGRWHEVTSGVYIMELEPNTLSGEGKTVFHFPPVPTE